MFVTEAVLAALLTVARRCKFLCVCVITVGYIQCLNSLARGGYIREGWQV